MFIAETDIMQTNGTHRVAILSLVIVLIVTGCARQGVRDHMSVDGAKRRGVEETSHIVERGDTLALITQQYDTPFATLVAANNLAPPYHLRAGEVLRIPRGVAARLIWPSPQRPFMDVALKQPATVASLAEPDQATAREQDLSHVVGPGESLSGIAARYDLSMAELLTVNKLDPPYHVHPGQRLTIPPSEEGLLIRARQLNERRLQQTIAISPSPPLSPDGFLWPVNGHVVRTFDQNLTFGESGAINIAARVGTPVRATNHGIVAYAGKIMDRYGQMVVVRHAEGYVSLYAHNEKLHVKEGDAVKQGQVIATVGKTGRVAHGQLRFELRKGLEPIDPVGILATRFKDA